MLVCEQDLRLVSRTAACRLSRRRLALPLPVPIGTIIEKNTSFGSRNPQPLGVSRSTVQPPLKGLAGPEAPRAPRAPTQGFKPSYLSPTFPMSAGPIDIARIEPRKDN